MILSLTLVFLLSVSVVPMALAFGLGLLAAAAGGALVGIRLGGADLGKEMAALMGAMYGLSAAVPGLVFGLLILAFI